MQLHLYAGVRQDVLREHYSLLKVGLEEGGGPRREGASTRASQHRICWRCLAHFSTHAPAGGARACVNAAVDARTPR